MTVPVIEKVPDDWEYVPEESTERNRKYICMTDNDYNIGLTVSEVFSGNYRIFGEVDSRIEEIYEDTESANHAAIEFMETQPE